jgi:hypothetical protein
MARRCRCGGGLPALADAFGAPAYFGHNPDVGDAIGDYGRPVESCGAIRRSRRRGSVPGSSSHRGVAARGQRGRIKLQLE